MNDSALWTDAYLWSDSYLWTDAYRWTDAVTDYNPLFDSQNQTTGLNDDE